MLKAGSTDILTSSGSSKLDTQSSSLTQALKIGLVGPLGKAKVTDYRARIPFDSFESIRASIPLTEFSLNNGS